MAQQQQNTNVSDAKSQQDEELLRDKHIKQLRKLGITKAKAKARFFRWVYEEKEVEPNPKRVSEAFEKRWEDIVREGPDAWDNGSEYVDCMIWLDLQDTATYFI